MVDENIRKEFEDLKGDFKKLRADIAELTEALRAAGTEKASGAKESFNQEYEKRREQLRGALKGARVRGEEAVDDIEKEIAEHPLSSLFMAFGLGFIIAKLIDGGKH